MKFTRDSVVVRAWVNQIKDGKKTKEQIPNLFNLREVVLEALEV